MVMMNEYLSKRLHRSRREVLAIAKDCADSERCLFQGLASMKGVGNDQNFGRIH